MERGFEGRQGGIESIVKSAVHVVMGVSSKVSRTRGYGRLIANSFAEVSPLSPQGFVL